MHLALTNPVLPAETAEQWGLVSLLVEDIDLPARARDLAETLARGPRQAQAATKRLLRHAMTDTYSAHLGHETDSIARLADTPDGREGVRAFLDKRPPSFATS
jgi:2-(1,2-epoxy-1,2-dihydrophenyl)acetyl-CoA isomerase